MNVSKIIRDKGYTIQQVADALGVARITVAKSITNNPKASTLRAIADVIGCDIADFFEDERKHTTNKSALICPVCGAKLDICITAKR